MNTKKDVLDALGTLTPSMCKGFVPGQARGVASNEYITLQVKNVPSNKLGDDILSNENTFVVAKSAQEKYQSYTCGDDSSTCTSVCVSSWEVCVVQPLTVFQLPLQCVLCVYQWMCVFSTAVMVAVTSLARKYAHKC